MTDGAKVIGSRALEFGKSLAPDVLAAVKRVARAHAKMVGARAVLRGMDAMDESYPEAVDEFDVQRGLFKQAVELEALALGREALTAFVVAIGELIG